MKMINKIFITIGAFILALFPFINLQNDIVVNAQIDSNISYPITDGVIDYDFFDDYLDGTYGYNFTYGERIYMQPKFNYLNSSLVDAISNTFTLGYFYHTNVSHLNGNLTFNITNNTITMTRDGVSNVYFNNGAFTTLNNIIYTSDYNAILTENQVLFLSANFNLSFTNNFNNTTRLNTILNTDNYYYIDYSFLRSNVGLMHFDTSINVNGILYDNTTFERIYFLKNDAYIILNGSNYSLINNENTIFKLTSVSNASYSNGLISLINRSFNIASSFGNFIQGWFTFDIEPFANNVPYYDLALDINFTTNNTSYERIVISYDNSLGYDYGTIKYVNLDYNGNFINYVDAYIYNSSGTTATSQWSNFNYRQVFFDKIFLSDFDFTFIDRLGTFTFISNNPNSNYSLTDLFWNIADIPYVTLRNLLGVEIFGTDLFIAFTSIISCILAIFILRKII